jgi:hypothetical protein
VELTTEQKDHYTRMLRHFVTKQKSGETITAVNEAVKIQKLVQIACGVAYGDDGQNIEIDCSPRINLVKEVIREAGSEKVILFVPLTGTLHLLEKELSKHWTTGVVNGEVSSSKRNKIFHDFQHQKDPHVLIAHPGISPRRRPRSPGTTFGKNANPSQNGEHQASPAGRYCSSPTAGQNASLRKVTWLVGASSPPSNTTSVLSCQKSGTARCCLLKRTERVRPDGMSYTYSPKVVGRFRESSS